MIRCCQSMLTWTFVMPRARSLWITCSVIPMFRMRIFIAGSEFLCSRKSRIPRSWQRAATSPTPSTNRAHASRRASGTGSCSPRSRARGSCWRSDRAGEVGCAQRLGECVRPYRVVGGREASLCRTAGSGACPSRSRRSRARRALRARRRHSPPRAPAGSGTRSRPSGRPSPETARATFSAVVSPRCCGW